MPTNNSINTPKPIDVSSGGTGLSTATTAYGVLAAGTTATGAFQNIGTGASGEVLTSNGAGALPTFQAAGGGGGDVVLLSSQSMNGVNTLTFSSFIDNTVYMGYNLKVYADGALSEFLALQISTNNGSSFVTTNYQTTQGQLSPGGGFFQWLSSQNSPYAILGFFGQVGPNMSQFDINLYPFGESLSTSGMGQSSFQFTGTPHLIWSSFYSATTNANAFKIFTPSLGTWTNGRACLYGIKK